MGGPDDKAEKGLPLLVDLIHERTGLKFENTRQELLAAKLSTAMKAGNFSSLMDYYYYLKYDNHAEEEWLRLQSVLAVNETYFFREHDAIAAAAKEIIPNLLQHRPDKPVRIWHPACASGEEPYTLAITLEEAGIYQAGRIEIEGTDFNQAALQQARSGIYRQRSFRRTPEALVKRYFTAKENGLAELAPEIRQRVRFSYLNLMDQNAMALQRNYDIIFCRNVFIYFSDVAVRQVVSWFYQSLNPSGYLFVAAAESLLRITHDFELIEVQNAFAYRKRSRLGE